MKKLATIFSTFLVSILLVQASCSAPPIAPSPSPATKIPPDFAGIDSATSTAPIGLTLSLTLNSTQFKPGEEVSVSVRERNILTNINAIQAAQSWPLSGLGLGP